MPPAPLPERAARFRERFAALEAEVGRVIVGQSATVRGVLTGLFVGGHVLLEGVPGLGKTLLVRTLARSLSLRFARIQFTPDLMPSDITGTTIIRENDAGRRDFQFRPGPLFAQIVLADEINRATPKTQSALLEAMQEKSVTVGGTVHALDEPFMVLATQNPIEQEGTYPLPEAQLDRFLFKLVVPFSTREELHAVLDRTTRGPDAEPAPVMGADEIRDHRELVREVIVARPVQDFAVRLLLATHPGSEFAPPDVGRHVRAGASPRGVQGVILAAKVRALLEGRYNVAFEDIRELVVPALRHRLLLSFEAQADGVTADAVLAGVLAHVPELPGGRS